MGATIVSVITALLAGTLVALLYLRVQGHRKLIHTILELHQIDRQFIDRLSALEPKVIELAAESAERATGNAVRSAPTETPGPNRGLPLTPEEFTGVGFNPNLALGVEALPRRYLQIDWRLSDKLSYRNFKIIDHANQRVTDDKAKELGQIVAGSEEFWKDRLGLSLPTSPQAKMISDAIRRQRIAIGTMGAEILAILEYLEACKYKLEID
jgi:hypothetical protein